VHQRQSRSSQLPPQSAFRAISKHFTATPRIPPASTEFKAASFDGRATVEPLHFTAD